MKNKTVDNLDDLCRGHVLHSLRDQFNVKVSNELKDKLMLANCDEEVYKILTDNGVDIKLFQNLQLDTIKSILADKYEELFNKIHCPKCNNSEIDEISYQVLTTIISLKDTYRCCKCNCIFTVDENNNVKIK